MRIYWKKRRNRVPCTQILKIPDESFGILMIENIYIQWENNILINHYQVKRGVIFMSQRMKNIQRKRERLLVGIKKELLNMLPYKNT